MVRRIQALNYRCLRHVDVRLDGNFHILVGPNASGKSTLIDVIGFFADLTPGSLENTVRRRVPDFTDLVWGRRGTGQRFELAIELDAEASSEDGAQGAVRYELAVCGDKDGPRIETVQGLAMGASVDEPRSARRFPEPLEPVPSLLSSRPVQDTRVLFVVTKNSPTIWMRFSHVLPGSILGWRGDYADLRNWLAGAGLWSSDKAKPSAPKQALKAVLRRTRTPLSAKLYRRLAEAVALDRCVDPAFNEFMSTLRRWFPISEVTDSSRLSTGT